MSENRPPVVDHEPIVIDVVIPAFNAAPYIAAALESVAGQVIDGTFAMDVVVVDDGSTDDTADVVARTAPDVRCLRRPHLGCGEARNHGVRETRGALIAFLDADDLWRPRKLVTQVEWLRAHPDDDMVFAQAEEFMSDDLTEAERRQIVRRAPMPARVAGTGLIRRAAFERVGYFAPEWRVGEFVQWALRAREAGLRDVILPEVLLSRRLHRSNMGRRLGDARGDYLAIIAQHLARRRAVAPAATGD